MDKMAPDPTTRKYYVGVGSPIVWTYEAEIVRMSSRPGLSPLYPGDPMLDLAILRVTRRIDGAQIPPLSFKPLVLADSDAVVEGEPVWILGYGQEGVMTNTRNTTKGIVCDRTSQTPRQLDSHDAEMLSGHSGGPAINKNGEVIAGVSNPPHPIKSWVGPINDAKQMLMDAGAI